MRSHSFSCRSCFAVCLIAAVLLITSAPLLAVGDRSEQDLAKLREGMTKADVIRIMGKPDFTREKNEGDLCSFFAYKNVGRYKIVTIWFDCNERLAVIDKAEAR